ncbi:MAG: AAA family ATPase [Saprospiraceae bacterium]
MALSLESISIRGYKSIAAVDLELNSLNILIGANGAGKSNFISLFNFLRHLVEQRLQVRVREAGGADKLLHYGSKTTPAIFVQLNFPPNYYRVTLQPSDDDSLFIQAEETGFHNKNQYPSPYWERIGSGVMESKLKGAAKSSNVLNYVYDVLKDWRVYHFHDTSAGAAVKKTGQINDNLFLREDAGNLAAFLYRMREEHPKHYERIVRTIQLVVPMFRDFLLRPDPFNPDSIRLEWLDRDSDYIFGASELSDGSLRFMCITTMLLQPNRPSLILLDEPELGLHPAAIQILAGLLKKVSSLAQLIVSTQSVTLVSAFAPEDVLVVEHHDKVTTLQRLEAVSLNSWLSEYSLGELWEKNVIGGRP